MLGIIGLISFTGAQAWGPTQRLTWDSMDSITPVLAVGTGNDLHVCWESEFPDNHSEIYYKKKHGWRCHLVSSSKNHMEFRIIIWTENRYQFQ